MVSKVENKTVTDTYETERTKKKSNVTGPTIGEPQLSEKASKYYEQLKKKFSSMDFILVSEDKKEQAKAQAGSYANASHMVVLIDEDKLERMAEDEQYRKKYEGIIQQAGTQMPQLQSRLGAAASKVKTFGIQVNDDGTASFFAVLKKNGTAQTKRIQEKAAEKKKAKKAAEKKANDKERQEQLKEHNQKGATSTSSIQNDYLNQKLQDGYNRMSDEEDTVTLSATSIDGLIQKIQDWEYDDLCNRVETKQEKSIGKNFDYRM